MFKSITIGFCILAIFAAPFASYGMTCSALFVDQNSLWGQNFGIEMTSKFGGSKTRWNNWRDQLHRTQDVDSLYEVNAILKVTHRLSFFRRSLNSVLFFKIYEVFSVLENLKVQNFDLTVSTEWSYLSLAERRAMLLLGFGKWWWEVDSLPTSGVLSKLRPSYIVSELLFSKTSNAPLAYRLDELLASPSSQGILRPLIRRFDYKRTILEQLKDSREDRLVLADVLEGRVEILLDSAKLLPKRSVSQNLVLVQALRSQVLSEMLRLNRDLTKTEVYENASNLGISHKQAELVWKQGLVMGTANLLNFAVEVAVLSLTVTVVSIVFFTKDPTADWKPFNEIPNQLQIHPQNR